MWYLAISIVLMIAITVWIAWRSRSDMMTMDIVLSCALAWVVGVIVLTAIGYPLLRLTTGFYEDYSAGERQGYVTKFSEKGILFKTWEGEIQIGTGQQAALQQPWAFSVPDELSDDVQALLGQRVRATYTEFLLMPWRYGETNYWLTSIEPLEAADTVE